jgi:Cytochrome P450
MRDPELFPDPESFRPERFIYTDNPRLKDFDLPFGFGRRICPGMHLALDSIYINVVRMLWAFDISPGKGANGKNSYPGVWDFTKDYFSRPVRFECEIRPRSEKVKECIGREWDSAHEVLGKWE